MTILAFLHPGDLALFEWLAMLLYVAAVPVVVFGGIFLLARLSDRLGGPKSSSGSKKR